MSSNFVLDMPAERPALLPRPCAVAHGPARLASYSRLKRLLDIVGAGTGLILLGPFLLLVSLLVWMESGKPVLFRQRRTGFGGVPFVIYKFRTMSVAEDGDVIDH